MRARGGLGAALLNRSTHGLHLTEVGTEFYEQARRIVVDVQDARSLAISLIGAPQGLLRINMPAAFGRLHVMPHLAAYPSIGVDAALADARADLVDAGVGARLTYFRKRESALMGTWLTVATALLPLCGAANAGSICRAVALRDTPAVDNPTTVLRKGEVLDSVTQYNVTRKNGSSCFCQHGGYCYYAHLTVGGKDVQSLKLLNCSVGKDGGTDPETQMFGVDVLRSSSPRAILKYSDLDAQFLKMGLCSACADNVARYYVKQPKSKCALLAKSALEGDPDAAQALLAGPPFCTWHY